MLPLHHVATWKEESTWPWYLDLYATTQGILFLGDKAQWWLQEKQRAEKLLFRIQLQSHDDFYLLNRGRILSLDFWDVFVIAEISLHRADWRISFGWGLPDFVSHILRGDVH